MGLSGRTAEKWPGPAARGALSGSLGRYVVWGSPARTPRGFGGPGVTDSHGARGGVKRPQVSDNGHLDYPTTSMDRNLDTAVTAGYCWYVPLFIFSGATSQRIGDGGLRECECRQCGAKHGHA